jgi:nitrous oxidase accessory protein NosD
VTILLALAFAAQLANIAPRDAAWAASLQPGQIVRLPAGSYRGPWKLGPGVQLIAAPGAVLEGGEDGAPVLTLSSDDELENLTVHADARAVGILAENADRLLFRGVKVSGGERGVRLHGGSIDWSGGGVEGGARFGIWTQGTHALLEGLRVQHIAGPAIFLGHSSAVLRELDLSEAEFGVLVLNGTLEMSRCKVGRVQRTGIGVMQGTGRLNDNQLEGPFSDGAISANSARGLMLRHNLIRHAGSIGIKLLGCEATLTRNEVAGARADKDGLEGDGLYLNGSEIVSTGDQISDVTGVGISVMGGHCEFKSCAVKGASLAAVSVESHGEAHFKSCSFKEGSLELIEGRGSTLKNETPLP